MLTALRLPLWGRTHPGPIRMLEGWAPEQATHPSCWNAWPRYQVSAAGRQP
jgi:hypothetical protein